MTKLEHLLSIVDDLHDYSGVGDAKGDEPDKKDIMRLTDIKDKAAGDEYKVLSLSRRMASLIKDHNKAIRRAKAAKLVFSGELGDKVYDIFAKAA